MIVLLFIYGPCSSDIIVHRISWCTIQLITNLGLAQLFLHLQIILETLIDIKVGLIHWQIPLDFDIIIQRTLIRKVCTLVHHFIISGFATCSSSLWSLGPYIIIIHQIYSIFLSWIEVISWSFAYLWSTRWGF